MTLLYKSLITLFTTGLITQNLYANTTICYKKNWKTPPKIEIIKLDGGECKGNFSFKDMIKKGWKLKDIKISQGNNGLNYSYILSDKKLIEIDNSNFKNNNYKKLDSRAMAAKLTNVTQNEAKVNIGNLKIGQSAVIQHYYTNSKSLIIANAYVTQSNKYNSTLKLMPYLDLKQYAIPTSNRKVENGDIAIINYLYRTSLIIAPTQSAFSATREKYQNNNFLHSDIFAAKLKIEGEPLPSKKTIQDFAISQNIGTLFFIIKNNVYIVDTKTFAILDTDTISYNFIENEQLPFYTRIEKIEKNSLESFFEYKSWFNSINNIFGEDKRSEEEVLLEGKIESEKLSYKGKIYNNYYQNILGIKK